MKYKDYLKQILAFNGDKDVITLRDKFNKSSFFEMISKERSETTYSAFLKWMFQENSTDKDACNPLALLLDILIRRNEEQETYVDTILSNETVKRSIVTRKLNIKSVKAETEKSVSSLAQEILTEPYSPESTYRIGKLSTEELSKIAAKSRDKIDLYIDCEMECEGISANRLQIIIENKIDSTEGGKKKDMVTGVSSYDNASQTERYYLATKYSTVDSGQVVDGRDTLQLYVYLTPQVPLQGACTDKHFIQINYQDIVDSILMPMLSSASLSARSRFFLEEFLNQLVFPSLDGTAVHLSIATGKEYSKQFANLWKKYQLLLTHSAISASEANLWVVNDVFYDHQPRTELLELLLAKGITSTDIINGQWKPGMQYAKMKDLAEPHGIKTEQVDLGLDDETQELLNAFWEKNQKLLTALINGMEDSDRTKVEVLLTQLSKRDTTRYNVYYNNTPLNNSAPLGKAMTALSIIQLWMTVQKDEGKDVTLDTLNKTFPRKCNPYYERGKWFKYLFYEVADNYYYDGEKAEGPVLGNWDFDKKGRFNIRTTDGKQVTMLKMWRKESLEALLEWVNKHKLFTGSLDVVPVS